MCRRWVDRYVERLGREERSGEERVKAMGSVNPIFILRAWIAQDAIEVCAKLATEINLTQSALRFFGILP